MGKLINFPMSLAMTRRVNHNQSYNRAYRAAMLLAFSDEVRAKSAKIRKEAEKFQEDLNKLYK